MAEFMFQNVVYRATVYRTGNVSLTHFIFESCSQDIRDKKVQDHEHLNMTTAPMKMVKVVIKAPQEMFCLTISMIDKVLCQFSGLYLKILRNLKKY